MFGECDTYNMFQDVLEEDVEHRDSEGVSKDTLEDARVKRGE